MLGLPNQKPDGLNRALSQIGIFTLVAISVFTLLLSGSGKLSIQPSERALHWQGGLVFWIRILLFPIVALIFASPLDKWFKANRTKGLGVAFFVVIVVVREALRPGLGAGFGPTDDHEIIDWLAGEKRVPWKHWSRILLGTDFGSYGVGSSFRPLYYVFRVTECCLYGSNVAFWYTSRMILCSTMLVLVWAGSSRYFGATLSFLMVFAIFGVPSTNEMFGRLGVGETFAMPLFVLGVWGMVPLIESVITLRLQENTPRWWLLRVWLPIFLGFVLVAGVKESYLPLSCLAWVLVASGLYWTNAPAARGRIPAVLMTIWALWIIYMAIGVARLVQNLGGTDLYGKQVVGLDVLLQAISRGIEGLQGPFSALFPIVIASCAIFVLKRKIEGNSSAFVLRISNHAGFFYLIVAPLAAWFAQALVYRENAWLLGNHYDGPAILIASVMTVGIIWHIIKFGAQSSLKPISDASQLLHFSLFVALMFSAGAGINLVKQKATKSSDMTRRFSLWIDSVATEANSNPLRVIVLVPDKPLEHYEAIVSTVKFLRSHQVSNTIAYTTNFLEKSGGINDTLVEVLEGDDFGHATRIPFGEWPTNALYVPFGRRALDGLVQKGIQVSSQTYDEVRL